MEFISYKPAQSTAPAHYRRLPLPPMTPSGRGWHWEIKADGSVDLVELPDFNKGRDVPLLGQQVTRDGVSGAQTTSPTARYHYAGNSSDDTDNDLPPIEDILSGKKKRGSANTGLNYKPTRTEQVNTAGQEAKLASPRGSRPGDSKGEPIVLDDDEPHPTTSDVGSRGFDVNRIESDSDTSCDSPSEIGGGSEGRGLAPAHGVDHQIINNSATHNISNQDSGRQYISKTFDRTADSNRHCIPCTTPEGARPQDLEDGSTNSSSLRPGNSQGEPIVVDDSDDDDDDDNDTDNEEDQGEKMHLGQLESRHRGHDPDSDEANNCIKHHTNTFRNRGSGPLTGAGSGPETDIPSLSPRSTSRQDNTIPGLGRLAPPHNSSTQDIPEEQILDEASKENLSDFAAGSPTEVASDDLYTYYLPNKGNKDGSTAGQEDEQRREQSSPSQRVSSLEHSPVRDSTGNSSPRTRKASSGTAGQDTSPESAPARKLSNDMDFVRRLSKEQQEQYAPLNDKASLPDIGTQPQAMPRPKKRSKSSARPSTRSNDAPPAKRSRRSDKEYPPSAFPETIHGLIPPPAVVPEDNQYIVERLLESRVRRLGGRNRRTVMQYLVKWEGYREEHNSWVDENDIHRDLIEAYTASAVST